MMTLQLRTYLAFALLPLLLPSLVFAASFTGKVVSVTDGDTILVLRDGWAEKVRLAGIDCPELNFNVAANLPPKRGKSDVSPLIHCQEGQKVLTFLAKVPMKHR